MLISDLHLHSNCSSDAFNTMTDMALSEHSRGVGLVCFTDHFDIDYYLTGRPVDNIFAVWPDVLKQYDDVRAACRSLGDMQLRLGIELGEPNHDPVRAGQLASQPEIDFILGSIHNLRATPDFCCVDYKDESHCYRLIDSYLDELLELAKMDCYDCISHIGYTRRYMMKAGFDVKVSPARHGDKLREIFRTVIESGKGIELNCSGFRNPGIGTSIPDLPILKLYHELGGEIITTGTDAHTTADAGTYLREGLELLSAAGFKYVAHYTRHNPEFTKIDI